MFLIKKLKKTPKSDKNLYKLWFLTFQNMIITKEKTLNLSLLKTTKL